MDNAHFPVRYLETSYLLQCVVEQKEGIVFLAANFRT